MFNINKVIHKLQSGQSLSLDESYQSGLAIFNDANDSDIETYLRLLSKKGETVDELLGMIKAVKERSVQLEIDFPIVDIVGTGGDNSGTLNISTASALLVAALGVPVIKHGNRSVSSKCGSADVLEKLGYKLDSTQEDILTEIKQNNFAFCFAQQYYPLFAKVKLVRKKIQEPTIFNLIGPLLNPAGIKHMVLGVYDPNKVILIAKTLLALGTEKSLVFHGNGLDELSCLGVIDAILVTPSGVAPFKIDPQSLGLKPCVIEDLKGDDSIYNTVILYKALSGEVMPFTDTLLLNVAVAIFIYGKTHDLISGIKLARERLIKGNILKSNRLLDIIARKMPLLTKRKSLKKAILAKNGKAIIGEIKRASPSLGKIAVIDNLVKKAEEYIKAGVSGISILTDEGFEGSINDLQEVASALKDTSIPILCKDFIFSAAQIAKAYEAGADAILIMISVLGDKAAEMVRIAHAFGLETLVEVHHESELPIALTSGGDLIGINQRDLRDFSMHPEVFTKLIRQIPESMVKIAESGISSVEDANKAYKLGFDGILVGQALSTLNDPVEFFKNLGVENVN